MSSLLEKALDALGDQVDDKADDWFEKLIDGLDGLIDETENDELREGGKEALQVVKDNQDKFIGLGKRSFTLFVANVAAGRDDEAAKEYYRSSASPREIIDAILDDADDLEDVYRRMKELKKEALELAKLLLKGAKFLLPFLLTLI
jgi:hypothetical protein